MANGCPKRNVSGGEKIGAPQAEHQVDLGRPRANAGQDCQLCQRHLWIKIGQSLEIKASLRYGMRQPVKRTHLCAGKPKAGYALP